MIIRSPNPSDWGKFISFAEDEGWRVPNSELTLFQGPWAEYSHVLDVGGFCGMVTTASYEKSAWIGNLIIPLSKRGNGYGTHLFKSVLADLIEQGIATVWLTASEQGRSIYEREGFNAVDSVERWVLPPQRRILGQKEAVCNPDESLMHVDSLVWGESRSLLLSELCNTGKVFSVGGAIALLQQAHDFQVLGPWYSHEDSMSVNDELLQMIVASRDFSVEMVIDCLTSSQIQSSLKGVGFQCSGKSTLLVYGDVKDVQLNSMVSLASLGSIG